jgi:hypothetical protein
LSDELDIVGAGVVVLVDEVVADLRATVEGARAAAPLVIGVRVMWERA